MGKEKSINPDVYWGLHQNNVQQHNGCLLQGHKGGQFQKYFP